MADPVSQRPPCKTSGDWPVEWQPVWGSRDGLLAQVETKLMSLWLATMARVPGFVWEASNRALARMAKVVDRRHSDAARRFIAQAYPDLSHREREALVLESYRHFLRVLSESRRLEYAYKPEERRARFDIVWTDKVREVIESGSGCVLVSAHQGNWEACLMILDEIGFGPVYAIAKPPKNLPLSKLVQSERESQGVRLLPRRGAMAEAPKIIRAGGALVLLLDQRARKRPVIAPFFGRPARCDRSAGVLVRRLNVPVFVVGCSRAAEPLRFRLEFGDCLDPADLTGATPLDIATRLNQAFEGLIRANPKQYFWLHDRFKDTPEVYPDESGGPAPARKQTEQA